MSIIQLKIDKSDHMLKHISLIRKFDPTLSIAAIKQNMEHGNYVINHGLYAYDLVEEIMGINRTVRFRQLITDLITAGATLLIYCEEELWTLELLDNKLAMLKQIENDLQEETDRALENE